MTADVAPAGTSLIERTHRMDTRNDDAPGGGRWFSAHEVCALVGISYRQLDYWLRAGYLGFADPRAMSGSGYPRRFDQAHVDQIRMLAWFVQAGLDPSKVRSLVDQLKCGMVRLSPQIVLVLDEDYRADLAEYDAWRTAEWEALPDNCFLPWCESDEIDTRGPVFLRDGSVQKACVDHWEQSMQARREQAAWEKSAMRFVPGDPE